MERFILVGSSNDENSVYGKLTEIDQDALGAVAGGEAILFEAKLNTASGIIEFRKALVEEDGENGDGEPIYEVVDWELIA